MYCSCMAICWFDEPPKEWGGEGEIKGRWLIHMYVHVDKILSWQVCMIVPFDLRTLADKEQQVYLSVTLKQQHSVAAQQTLIRLLGESGIARTILWDSLLACWMT